MISIFCKDNDINYIELYELVKSFYPLEEIQCINSVNELNNYSYLIKITLNGNIFCASAFANGELKERKCIDISETKIYRDANTTKKITAKRALYALLNTLTHIDLPWGILTGIKPVKIPSYLLQLGINKESIEDILTNQYYISKPKAKMALDIAISQQSIINEIKANNYSLYIHIPFCTSRCSYCSFPSLPLDRHENIINDYTDKLIEEIKAVNDSMKGWESNTIYIGGGTPTSLPIELIEKILYNVKKLYPNIKELTVEAGRPDTIDYEKLSIMYKYGVDRISINPQTMNDRTLKMISRNHSSDDIIRTYIEAKEVGIKTVNMDLIIGLPGENLEDVKATLEKIKPLNPDNLTVHTLSYKKGSALKNNNEYYLTTSNMIENMQNECIKFATANSLVPYYLYRQKMMVGNLENIGFSREHNPCIYNISMMEEKETIIGCGMGATTKIYNKQNDSIKRIANPKDMNLYFERFYETISNKLDALK